jgi:hypothetical protein
MLLSFIRQFNKLRSITRIGVTAQSLPWTECLMI